MLMKKRNVSLNQIELNMEKSIEEFENKHEIQIPKHFRRHKRFGFPKSKLYKSITPSRLEKNHITVNKELGIS